MTKGAGDQWQGIHKFETGAWWRVNTSWLVNLQICSPYTGTEAHQLKAKLGN